jgi:hypothetical protein
VAVVEQAALKLQTGFKKKSGLGRRRSANKHRRRLCHLSFDILVGFSGDNALCKTGAAPDTGATTLGVFTY